LITPSDLKHIFLLERKKAFGEVFYLGTSGDLPWFRKLLVGLSTQNSGFDSRTSTRNFCFGKILELKKYFLRVLRFSPVSVIPPLFRLFHIFRVVSVIQFSEDNVA